MYPEWHNNFFLVVTGQQAFEEMNTQHYYSYKKYFIIMYRARDSQGLWKGILFVDYRRVYDNRYKEDPLPHDPIF